ncbi:MAG: lysostaphin resistance A-like protein [Terracidiphilus sp.]
MNLIRPAFKSLLALAIAAAAFLAAFWASRFIHLPRGGFTPGSFVLQSIYLVLCTALMIWFSKGRLAEFGFTWGKFKPSLGFFLCLVPALAAGLLSVAAARSGHGAEATFGLTKLQFVVFVWIYSSICEEVLTRGLLQTLLQNAVGAEASGRLRRGIPVVLSGLFFGAMHLALVPKMGAGAAPIIVSAVYLGLVAAYYRQKTGSLLLPVLLHMFFNVAGSLPAWIAQWMR